MALNLIVLGPPGAGKGTQAERFARTRGIPRISTGEILREAVHAGTEVGRRVKAVMARGELVGDDVMIGIVRDRLERDDARSGFVLDGFPRTVAQATALDSMLNGRDPLIVVEIVVPEAELVRRLSVRMICDDCGATAGGFAEPGSGTDAAVLASAASADVRSEIGPRQCRLCGGRLGQRSDDDDSVVRERLRIYLRQTQPLVAYYSGRPTFRSVNGAQQPERVAADLAAAIEAAARSIAPLNGVRP